MVDFIKELVFKLKEQHG